MISIILLDSKVSSLKNLKIFLESCEYVKICGFYSNRNDFLDAFETQSPDVVLLHVDLPESHQIETAINIRSKNNDTKIIFVSAHQGYVLREFELNALDSILKQIEIEHHRKSIIKSLNNDSTDPKKSNKDSSFYINCFKKFNFSKKTDYLDSFKWRTKKVKELFAYLICNYEKTISKDELISILFAGEENKNAHNNLYVTMSYLRKQLQEFGIDRNKLLIRGDYTLEIADGMCDFVDFDRFLSSNVNIDDENIDDTEEIMNLYQGMLLEQEDYLWVCETREYLDQKYEETLLSIGSHYKEHRELKKSEKALLKILSKNPLSYAANTQLLDLYLDYKKKDLFIKHFLKYSKLLEHEFNELPESRYIKKYHMLIQED